jgi:hypothetical protein
MNTNVNLSFPSHGSAFDRGLTLEAVRERAPAVFAPSAHERMSPKYTFIPTERVLAGLMSAGFVPVEARQTRARSSSPLHARHVVRLRRRFETVQLKGSVPEVVFLNSHDGTSAYLMLIFACHHRRDSTCYPAYLQLASHRGTMVTFSEELTVRNGEAGARDHLILCHRSRRQGAPLLTRCARCGRPAATALMLLMP